jgi:uncharacterized RDD family membrane protein YckC
MIARKVTISEVRHGQFEREYSGLGRRLAAHLVDLVIVSSVLLLHGMTFRILRAAGMWKLTNAESVSAEELWQSFGVAPNIAVVLGFAVTSGMIYFLVFESSARQATPGKADMNIFVTRDDQSCPRLGCAVGRWLAKWFAGWFGGSLISMGMIGGLPNQHTLLNGRVFLLAADCQLRAAYVAVHQSD